MSVTHRPGLEYKKLELLCLGREMLQRTSDVLETGQHKGQNDWVNVQRADQTFALLRGRTPWRWIEFLHCRLQDCQVNITNANEEGE